MEGAAARDVKQVWLLVDMQDGTSLLQHVHFQVTDRLPELNALVYEMYGLSPDEIALVESLTAGAYAEGAKPVDEDELEAVEVSAARYTMQSA